MSAPELTRDEWRDMMVEAMLAARNGDQEAVKLYTRVLTYHDEYLRSRVVGER